jgi:hypothetical protein
MEQRPSWVGNRAANSEHPGIQGVHPAHAQISHMRELRTADDRDPAKHETRRRVGHQRFRVQHVSPRLLHRRPCSPNRVACSPQCWCAFYCRDQTHGSNVMRLICSGAIWQRQRLQKKKPATAWMGDRVRRRVLTTTQLNRGRQSVPIFSYRNWVTTLSV